MTGTKSGAPELEVQLRIRGSAGQKVPNVAVADQLVCRPTQAPKLGAELGAKRSICCATTFRDGDCMQKHSPAGALTEPEGDPNLLEFEGKPLPKDTPQMRGSHSACAGKKTSIGGNHADLSESHVA